MANSTSVPLDRHVEQPLNVPTAADLIARLTSEGLIGMRAAAKLYGEAQDGKAPHASTPTRHALRGVRLRDGRVIKLEIVRISGRIMTSRAAVLRFFAAQNEPIAAADDRIPESPNRRVGKRCAASAELDALLGTRRDPEGA